jgi:hypothetical protein
MLKPKLCPRTSERIRYEVPAGTASIHTTLVGTPPTFRLGSTPSRPAVPWIVKDARKAAVEHEKAMQLARSGPRGRIALGPRKWHRKRNATKSSLRTCQPWAVAGITAAHNTKTPKGAPCVRHPKPPIWNRASTEA